MGGGHLLLPAPAQAWRDSWTGSHLLVKAQPPGTLQTGITSNYSDQGPDLVLQTTPSLITVHHLFTRIDTFYWVI